MSTVNQLKANRENARRGTGPKTVSGKARSSMNACKHGLTAQTVVIGDEDPTQFDCLRQALEKEFEPRSLMARELVERLAGIVWRLRRIPKFEAALIEARCDQARCDVYNTETRKRLEGPGGATGVALIEDSKHQDDLANCRAMRLRSCISSPRHFKCSVSFGQWRTIQLSTPWPFHRIARTQMNADKLLASGSFQDERDQRALRILALSNRVITIGPGGIEVTAKLNASLAAAKSADNRSIISFDGRVAAASSAR